MDWPEALEILVRRTGHERFRSLCDGSHRDHAAWRRKVVEKALALPPDGANVAEAPRPEARPSAAEALALARRMNACPYRSTRPPCGCQGGRCALKGGAIVSHRDCFDCLGRYPEPPP